MKYEINGLLLLKMSRAAVVTHDSMGEDDVKELHVTAAFLAVV